MLSDTFRSLRRMTLVHAQEFGFRVRHRQKDFKHDEQNAKFLFDAAIDQSSGLKVEQKVTVSGYLFPPIFSDLETIEEVGESDGYYYSNRLYRILGFVEVEAKVGKCTIKSLYCALVSYGIAGTEGPVIDINHDNKVNLHWVGSLKPLSWEEK